MLSILIAVVIGLFVGYIWGKHKGMLYGNQQGLVSVPLLLRQQSLEKGYCILCNKPKRKRKIYKFNEKGRNEGNFI